MTKLAKQDPKIEYKLVATTYVPSMNSLLSTVDNIFGKYPKLQNYIVFQSL